MGPHAELQAALDELTASLADRESGDVVVLDDDEPSEDVRARRELLEELRGL